jgi:hypothetical protein
MRRVRHSVVAFGTTAAAIMSVIAADLRAHPARAQAEDWPTRPLTLVVPFSAGRSSDTIGRIIADGISSNLRQPVVVENVAGAGGMVGGSVWPRPHLTAINSLSETSGPSPTRESFATVFESPGVRIGMDVMLSDCRHWLEYDPVALAALLVGVGFVELIVLSI